MSSQSNRGGSMKKSIYYVEHLSVDELHALLASGKAVAGRLKVLPTMRKKGFVECRGLNCDVLIEDDKFKNRAFIGDRVVVELSQEDLDAEVDFSEQDSTAGGNNGGGGATLSDSLKAIEIGEESEESLDKFEKLWRPEHELLKNFEASAIVEEERREESLIKKRYFKRQPKGKVVGILESNHLSRLVGSIVPMVAVPQGERLPQTQSKLYFEPNNKCYPNAIITRDELPEAYIANPNAMSTTIFVVDLVPDWHVESKFPFVRNARSLGELGSVNSETEALLLENLIPHREFTKEMMASIETVLGVTGIEPHTRVVDWKIPEEEISRRRDLRHKRVFTVDPTSAKDLDDALHVDWLGDDVYEIGVHIADVSYFLREKTDLDSEAQLRATSVYLVQKVLPMLPPILSENLCSLNPNVDRLAFSCIWKMRSDGTLLENEKPYFGRTVIRSCAKLDYATAQRMIDGDIPDFPFISQLESASSASSNCKESVNSDAHIDALPEEIWSLSRRPIGHTCWECARDVKYLNKIASNRRKIRTDKGALTVSNAKLSFSLDSDGNPISVSKYEIKGSNKMIEEYMLLANYFVAEKLLKSVRGAAFIRNHKPPDYDSLRENLMELSEEMDLPICFDDLKSFKSSMQTLTASEKYDDLVASSIGAILMRSLPRAEYLVASSQPPDKWKHFGLNIPYYTHFTSPIRRYADVMVHRLLEISLLDAPSAGAEALQSDLYIATSRNIASRCNDMKNNSRCAQLRSDTVFLSIYLMNNPQIVTGRVIAIGEKSFSVHDFTYGVTKRIFVDQIPGVDAYYSEDSKSLTLHKISNDTCRLECASISIKVATDLKLELTACTTPPIDVNITILNVSL